MHYARVRQDVLVRYSAGNISNDAHSMTVPRSAKPESDAIKAARMHATLTQTQAGQLVHASLRAWQQWESGERGMPPGLFELFMIKTGQWSLEYQG